MVPERDPLAALHGLCLCDGGECRSFAHSLPPCVVMADSGLSIRLPKWILDELANFDMSPGPHSYDKRGSPSKPGFSSPEGRSPSHGRVAPDGSPKLSSASATDGTMTVSTDCIRFPCCTDVGSPETVVHVNCFVAQARHSLL